MVAVGGTLYGPSLIPAGSSASPRTTVTPVSQSAVTGAGTSADPFQIVTEVQLGSSGLRLVQTDSYVEGEEAYRTSIDVWRVSVAADGSQASDASDNPAITEDGATIAFQSMAANLVPRRHQWHERHLCAGQPVLRIEREGRLERKRSTPSE